MVTTTTSAPSVLQEIEAAIGAAESFAPVISGISMFIPTVGPWVTAAMALLGLVGNAVNVVQQNQGLSLADSITAVAQHLTPGQPAAPALSPTAPAQVASAANPTG